MVLYVIGACCLAMAVVILVAPNAVGNVEQRISRGRCAVPGRWDGRQRLRMRVVALVFFALAAVALLKATV